MTAIATIALIVLFLAAPQAGEAAARHCGPTPAAFDATGLYTANQARKTCISHIAERI